MTIFVKKLDEKAILPTYGTEDSAGADLYALPGEDIVIPPGETAKIRTGLSMELPRGYGGFIFARSGLATKRGLAPANKVGVIDADYRGEILVALYNQSKDPQTVQGGERVAQLVLLPVLQGEFLLAENLSDTARGDGGFGSTGSR